MRVAWRYSSSRCAVVTGDHISHTPAIDAARTTDVNRLGLIA
jgi:hypothetical protein